MVEARPWSIVEARARARDGAVACVEELLERRSRAAESAAWISQPPPSELRARAVELDRRMARGDDLPLAGVPFAVKDNIDVAGVPTTAGCAEFATVAVRSAPVVEQLLGAGAVYAGKTNLDQFATGLVGTRSPRYGVCRNPVDPAYIAGGSSSGSAIVVATGQVPIALGTDTAGSGRVPAALCGVVGAKPTPGVVTTEGVVPAMPSFDCVSVFASTVADCRTVFDVWQVRAPRPVRAPRRVGIPAPLDWRGDDDARARFDDAVAHVESLGCTLTEVDSTPMYEASALVYGSALVAERYAAFGDFALAQPSVVDPAVLDIVRRAGTHSAGDFARALTELSSVRARAASWWNDVDALLLPTVARVPTIAEAMSDPFGPSRELGLLTAFVNPLHLAAVAVPSGTRSSGLPFGISLIGPAGSDRDLLALAAAYTAEPYDDDLLSSRPHRIAVVGAHLAGQPLNHQLVDRDAVFCARTTTAPEYRLYALEANPPKPGLVRTARDGAAIEVEVWALDAAGFGGLVAAIPAPLGIGKVALADGTEVSGFLCEGVAVEHARDITEFGGWRAYLDHERLDHEH